MSIYIDPSRSIDARPHEILTFELHAAQCSRYCHRLTLKPWVFVPPEYRRLKYSRPGFARLVSEGPGVQELCHLWHCCRSATYRCLFCGLAAHDEVMCAVIPQNILGCVLCRKIYEQSTHENPQTYICQHVCGSAAHL